MRLSTLEIAWHETLPVYSCDLQPQDSSTHKWTRLATAGGDRSIRLWKVVLEGSEAGGVRATVGGGDLEFLATLRRHEKPVNVVRWSPSGETLASGSDDSLVLLWRQNETTAAPLLGEDEEEAGKESWLPYKSLRRHLEDVYDLCWSLDEKHLVSGSVDQCAIEWRLRQDVQALILKDHKHYVQGVTWDPLDQYVVSLGSDRSCRVYRVGSRNCSYNLMKAGKMKLFQDDSWKSFFRRLHFSPDGLLLVCPAGCLETGEVGPDGSQSQHAAHIFTRSNLSRPAVSLPTLSRPVIAVRFCPVKYELRGQGGRKPVFRLAYRWVFCLVLEDGLLLYDTQSLYPFAQINNIHYQALNDASWSTDGRVLVTCSTDGYCSLVRFDPGELGTPLYSDTDLAKKSAVEQELDGKKVSPSTKAKTENVSPVKSLIPQEPVFVSPVVQRATDTLTSETNSCSKKTKRRIPLITLDPAMASPPNPRFKGTLAPKSPATAEAVALDIASQCSPMIVTSSKDASVIGETSGASIAKKRRVGFVTLDSFVQTTPSRQRETTQVSQGQTQTAVVKTEPVSIEVTQENKQTVQDKKKVEKRRVSFTTLTPEVRHVSADSLSDVPASQLHLKLEDDSPSQC